MLLHLPAFLEGQRPVLQQQTRWEPDLADVVNQAAEVRPLLSVRREAHPLSDVARVDGDGL